MATQIQVRKGTAATWTTANPTLAAGEPGYETDTGKLKVGDGTTAWTSLAYLTLGTQATNTLVGNVSGSTGRPTSITGTQATALLDTFTTSAKGLVPSPTTSAGKFLKDDGTWAAAGGGGPTALYPVGSASRYLIAGRTIAAGVNDISNPGYTFFYPFVSGRAVSVTEIGFIGTSGNQGGTPSSPYKFAIYSADATTALPSTNLVSGTCSATNVKSLTISSTSLTANTLYYLAFITSSTSFIRPDTYSLPLVSIGSNSTGVEYTALQDATTTYAGGFPTTPNVTMTTAEPRALYVKF